MGVVIYPVSPRLGTGRELIKGLPMSKKKKKNQSPNIPQATIERTQQQVGQAGNRVVEDVKQATEQVSESVEEAADEVGFQVKPVSVTPLTPPVRRVRAVRTAPGGSSRPATNRSAPKKDPKTDTAYIRSRLANPTRFVTEAELKAEYGYVISDLRTMGILAAILVVVLFLLERFL